MILINKNVQGFFTRPEQILPFINEEGRETLEELNSRLETGVGDSNEDSEQDTYKEKVQM